MHPKVIEWARRKIGEAANPQGVEAKAKALLEAIKREKFFIPDPVDGDFLAAPECLLADCDGISLDGGDCDELTAALAAAMEAIGITVAVVAQAFDVIGSVQHVLVVAEVMPGVWKYADPSEKDLEFGQAKKPSREVWWLVPSGKLLCDHRPSCMGKMAGVHPDTADRKKGDLVVLGVGSTGANLGSIGQAEGSAGMSWGSAILGVAAAVAAVAVGAYVVTGESPMKLVRRLGGPGWYVIEYDDGEVYGYDGPFVSKALAKSAAQRSRDKGFATTIKHLAHAPSREHPV